VKSNERAVTLGRDQLPCRELWEQHSRPRRVPGAPWQCRGRARDGLDAQGMRAKRREILAAVHLGSRIDQQIAIRSLLLSQALPAFWQSTYATGLVPIGRSIGTATEPTIARREQARVPGSERVSAARRTFVQRPSTPPFPAYGLCSLFYQRPRP
jgi:hypothetical protein